MNLKQILFLVTILGICLFSFGCQNLTTEVPTPFLPTGTPVTPSPVLATVTKKPRPTAQPTEGSRIVSQEKLICMPSGTFVKCIDKTLGIEFEHPASWGEIEGLLRTGWDSGYLYKYIFIEGTAPGVYLPDTGGVSTDFAEGREWNPLDFGGFGDQRTQDNSCEEKDLYPICNEVGSGIKWMIRFPNAKYLCENAHFFISPIVRIEVNLPNSDNVTGFALETNFLSEHLKDEIKREIYSTFLVETPDISFPKDCGDASRQAFDEKVHGFIERLNANSVDAITQKNLNDLMHFAESILVK